MFYYVSYVNLVFTLNLLYYLLFYVWNLWSIKIYLSIYLSIYGGEGVSVGCRPRGMRVYGWGVRGLYVWV